MSSINSPVTSPLPNLVGLDVVRVLAMIMVVIQHTLSLADREDLTVIAGLSIGQLGVAIFLVVSGLLSCESRRTPVGWLSQRLCRVYPAFWIAMIGSFYLATISGYKNASIGQIASQMLGTGLWTHADELVNSPTWFVSLILACYFATFLSRVIGRPGLVAAVCSIGLTIAVACDAAPWLLSHFLTYAVSCTIAAYAFGATRNAVTLTIAAAFGIMALTIQPAFAYTALSLMLVELSLQLRSRPRAIKLAADYSYEFYLVHGVALAGALTIMKNAPVLAVIAALTGSAVAAVILNHVATFIVRQLRPANSSQTQVKSPTRTIKAIPQT
jgi:peptidoglycan/LPS O-acetylase OafA/YrhL